jgi:DNA-binding NtrC family response regulator
MMDCRRILIVDDEKKIGELYSAMLEDLGYYVKTAQDGCIALTCVSEEKFDIVFLDQFLGSTKGLDLMQKMLEIDPDLSFVIITGNSTSDIAVESLKRGASDFYRKAIFKFRFSKEHRVR